MKVAVAVITDDDNRILITQRPETADHGGFWEFPGGKLESGESETGALIREIKEEVGLDVIDYEFLDEINHTYSKYPVTLLIYHVSAFSGKAVICEGQLELRWVEIDELENYRFPAANERIVSLIKNMNWKRLY